MFYNMSHRQNIHVWFLDNGLCRGGAHGCPDKHTYAAQAKATNGGEGEMSPKEEAAMPTMWVCLKMLG